jgi:hypothetical protein
MLGSASIRSSRAIPNGLATCNKRFSSIPVVEVREDKIYPHLVQQYLIHHNETSNNNVVPKQPHLRLHCLLDTGGILNQAIRIYAYPGGLEEREHLRHSVGSSKDMGCDPEELSSKVYIIEQSSNIYAEAPLTTVSEGIRGLMKPPSDLDTQETNNAASIYEFRKYYLKLGYDTVPKFLSLYEAGLPSKLGAVGSDPTTSLITLLYTEVGQLNEVIEVWKHGGGVKAMEKSRVAARSAPEWRQAIKEIAELAVYFRSTIYIPLTSSPLN